MPRSTLFIDLDSTIMVNPFASAVFPIAFGAISRAAATPVEAVREAVFAEHDRRLGSAAPPYAKVMDWDDILGSVAASLGAEFDLSLTSLVCAHCAPPHIAEIDDAVSVLSRIKSTGSRRLVVSSMGLSFYQFPVLKALGLYDLFDLFLTPDLTGYLKWHAEFYATCLTDAEPGELFISLGDMYRDDVEPAKRLGFASILKVAHPAIATLSPFERPAQLEGPHSDLPGRPDRLAYLPDAVISHLSELRGVISELETRAMPR